MHQPNGVNFATTRLATGPRLHYAEQGDRAGVAGLRIGHSRKATMPSVYKTSPLKAEGGRLQPFTTSLPQPRLFPGE